MSAAEKRNLAHNINLVRQKIARAAQAVERDPQQIELMLVTKTVAATTIKYCLELGETLFGENKVQELNAKMQQLNAENAVVFKPHMIGHLQSNKIKNIIETVDCIESLDSLKLANALEKRLENSDLCIDVLIEVNTSFESSKHGIAYEDAYALTAAILPLERLKVRGFMTIGALDDNRDKVSACFARLRTLRERVRDDFSHYGDFATLSMGMSEDLELAIAQGSTRVRVGSAIFGSRVLQS